MLQDDRFWVADTQLAYYEILQAEERPAAKRIVQQGSVFGQPPVLLGKTLIGVRTTDLPGTLISAIEDARRDPTWQTEVAAPLPADALLPGPDGKLTVVTASAAMFRIDVRGLAGDSIVDRPLLRVIRGELSRPVAGVVPMPGRLFAMIPGGEPNQIVLFDPKEEQRRFRWLLVPDSVMACPPIAFAGGLLAPLQNGQVLLLDPQSTENLAEPFEPELKIASPWTWRQPVAVDAKEAVLSDGDKRLYRLGVDSSREKPRLVGAGRGEGRRADRLAAGRGRQGRLCRGHVGHAPLLLVAVARRGQDAPSRRVLRVGSAGLRPPRPAGHRQGPPRLPRRPARRALADRSSLWSAGRRAWDAGKQFILASRSGVVWRVDAATGKESGKVETGCPLGSGVVEAAGRLFVGSADGCVYEVKL